MVSPIMPQGTAVWLIENTALTFNQIADFCGLHVLEIQALADGQVSVGMMGVDPIRMGQLTADEIERCSRDPKASLIIATPKFSIPKSKSKKKYTPLIKRQERPDAIAWLVKFYPEMSDATICALVSTTKNTIISIRNRTHARMSEIRPKDPVLLGFCTQIELDSAIASLKNDSEDSKKGKKTNDNNAGSGEQVS
ncbi:MAG: DUF1013 domain-containing protein [Holosporaceae bacterium]|jgi:hypothetical protein|nr:DUF1013 domain-containing protein [Holosporaceae bacterium]